MKNNEQFYTDGCGIMIDGDDDVRLECRGDYLSIADPDAQPEAAEVHFMSGSEFNFAGVLKANRHERYVDDITGQPLSPELCQKARATELDHFRDKISRNISEALRRTAKPPISVRWVEVYKGDGP